MNKEIYQEIQDSTNLIHVREGMIRAFSQINNAGESRIGYVSGVVTSDGDQNISENLRRLALHTELISSRDKIPAFSTAEVFGNEMYSKVEEFKFERELREEHFRDFWKHLLESGHITDVYMTPGWERSIGATMEHKIAEGLKINVHYETYESLND